MKSYREQFEEVWPVPDGISYANGASGYAPYEFSDRLVYLSLEHNARLDTFSRCQETTDVYLSLVDELVNELDEIAGWVEAGRADGDDVIRATRLTDRAKQILGRE